MKTLRFVIVMFILIIYFTNCNKKGDAIPVNNDSISLKYVDIQPDTTFINLGNDTIKILYAHWLEQIGPHAFPKRRFTLKSTNPATLMVSYGKVLSNYKLLLDKDSIIDEKLDWKDTYIIDGPDEWIFNSQYIGIKMIRNGKTFFGWIHKPAVDKMAAFALDTSLIPNNRKVTAGRLKK